MENSNCDIDISIHALWKHNPDTFKYVGIGIGKVFEVLKECIGEIFEKGKPQPVSARWREIEKERRSTIVKYLNKTFRVVVAKTATCYLIVTVHPYPNRQHDVDCNKRTRQSSSSA
jgi:aspartate/methionine/tyrosine aminotransferase